MDVGGRLDAAFLWRTSERCNLNLNHCSPGEQGAEYFLNTVCVCVDHCSPQSKLDSLGELHFNGRVPKAVLPTISVVLPLPLLLCPYHSHPCSELAPVIVSAAWQHWWK